MNALMIDSNAFRAYELAGWQGSVEAYNDHIGSLTSQTIGPLLDAVKVEQNTSLLDMATGPGYVAAAARRRGANVVGVDFSESMIAKARRLYPGIDFRIDDVERLSFSDGEFEAAVMNFGILHLARPDLALSEAWRILRPQGRFGFTAWANLEEALGFRLVMKAIEKHGDTSVPLPQGPPFFLFSDTAECIRALTASGFSSITVARLPMTWKLKSADDLFDAFHKGTARTGGLLRAQSKTSLDAIRAEIQDAAENYRKGGIIQIPMPAVIASAMKP
jgi:SAM-dependent methyltransferase